MSRAIRRCCSVSVDLVEPRPRPPHRQRRELVDAEAADAHRARLGPQARALARRARHHRHELLDLLALELGFRLAVAPLEVVDDPLELRRVGAPAPVAVAVGDLDAVAVGAEEEEVLGVVVEVLPRQLEVDVVLLGDRLGDLLVVVRRRVRPRQQRALADRQRRVGHHEVGVDLHLRAEAGAALARAVRRVEREDPRLELRHRGAARQAGEALGERPHVSARRRRRSRSRRSRPPGRPPSRSSRPGACAPRAA